MEGKLLQLYDQKSMTKELIDDSIGLIHMTQVLSAIKKLVSIADILNLNLTIHEKFSTQGHLIWDVSALQELAVNRRELRVYHRGDFKPLVVFDAYDDKLLTLVRVIAIKHPSLYDTL